MLHSAACIDSSFAWEIAGRLPLGVNSTPAGTGMTRTDGVGGWMDEWTDEPRSLMQNFVEA